MSRTELLRMARRNIAHVKADTIDRTPEVLRVPAAEYTDPARFQRELERVWKRTPLVLALSCELREPGDFRALEVAGVPVLLARGADGAPRAFVNSCAHRGAQIALEPSGNVRRFVCPYHAWSYDWTARWSASTRATTSARSTLPATGSCACPWPSARA